MKHNQIRGSIVVSISARHAEDPGSTPGRGVYKIMLRGFPGKNQRKLLKIGEKAFLAGSYPSSCPSCPALHIASMKQNQIRGSIVVSISARHAEDPGSVPGRGVT